MSLPVRVPARCEGFTWTTSFFWARTESNFWISSWMSPPRTASAAPSRASFSSMFSSSEVKSCSTRDLSSMVLDRRSVTEASRWPCSALASDSRSTNAASSFSATNCGRSSSSVRGRFSSSAALAAASSSAALAAAASAASFSSSAALAAASSSAALAAAASAASFSSSAALAAASSSAALAAALASVVAFLSLGAALAFTGSASFISSNCILAFDAFLVFFVFFGVGGVSFSYISLSCSRFATLCSPSFRKASIRLSCPAAPPAASLARIAGKR